jgi:hypothetical protein
MKSKQINKLIDLLSTGIAFTYSAKESKEETFNYTIGFITTAEELKQVNAVSPDKLDNTLEKMSGVLKLSITPKGGTVKINNASEMSLEDITLKELGIIRSFLDSFSHFLVDNNENTKAEEFDLLSNLITDLLNNKAKSIMLTSMLNNIPNDSFLN